MVSQDPKRLYITLLIMLCMAISGHAASLGGEHDIFVATHLACKSFRVDLAQKGYHTYNIKGADQFNNYMKKIFEEAAQSNHSPTLSALVKTSAFNSALETCYPGNQLHKDLFIKNLVLIKNGGIIQKQAVDIAIFVVGLVPGVKIIQFLKTAQATGMIIYNTMEAAILSFALSPILKELSEKGYKIVVSTFSDSKSEQAKNILAVPPISEQSYFDSNALRRQNLSLLLEARDVLKAKMSAIKTLNEPRLSVLASQLASVENQINEIKRELN